MKHLHTFESFLNEVATPRLLKSAGQNLARQVKNKKNYTVDQLKDRLMSTPIVRMLSDDEILIVLDHAKEELGITESATNEATDYAVMLTGGSIGDKPRPRDAKGFIGMDFEVEKGDSLTNLTDAKAKAKRMNGNLSPGEKSHYGLKYIVVPVSNGKFVKESVNEELNEAFKDNREIVGKEMADIIDALDFLGKSTKGISALNKACNGEVPYTIFLNDETGFPKPGGLHSSSISFVPKLGSGMKVSDYIDCVNDVLDDHGYDKFKVKILK